jgi:hypothetical protein
MNHHDQPKKPLVENSTDKWSNLHVTEQTQPPEMAFHHLRSARDDKGKDRTNAPAQRSDPNLFLKSSPTNSVCWGKADHLV